MGVYIQNMKMPKTCGACKMSRLMEPNYVCCSIMDRFKKPVGRYNDRCIDVDLMMKSILAVPRPDWCPLIDVPDPHGRMIDADALLKDAEVPAILYPYKRRDIEIHTHAVALGDVMNAPTVIPASKEAE